MTFETLLREASALPPKDRLRLIDALTDEATDELAAPAVPAWHVEILQDRLDDMRRNPADCSPAEKTMRSLRERLGTA